MIDLTPWVLPSVAGVVVGGGTTVAAWRRRARPGATALALLAAAVAWWCLFQALSLPLTTLSAKLLAARFQYLGIALTPFAWLLFAVTYTRISDSPLVQRLLVLSLLPQAATLVLAWTNEYHHLVWRNAHLVRGGGFVGLGLQHGPWFGFFLLYSYALIFLATGLLFQRLAQLPYGRERLVAVVVAPLIPCALNLLYLSPFQPEQWIDLSPFGLALGGVVLAVALLRHGLLDLVPVPRGEIVEAMRDGVVVLDRRLAVVDLNGAATRILGIGLGQPLPAPFADLVARQRDAGLPAESATLVREADDAGTVQAFAVTVGPAPRQVGVLALVVTIRDVTERYLLEEELRRVGEELARANRELQRRANTDALTGLFNRHRFMEQLGMEMERARRFHHPLALVMLDLDHFKRVNDTHGHPAGDAVLRAVGALILGAVRQVDTAARLGGEEFAILLPETELEGACTFANRLVERLRNARLELPDGARVSITASSGVAAVQGGVETSTDALLGVADGALYRAKSHGRNRVHASVCSPADPTTRP